MPLWSPVDDRRASIGTFRKVLNMAFRPPDQRSTEKLIEESQNARQESKGLMARIRASVRRPPK